MYSEGTKREVAETAIKRVDLTTDEREVGHEGSGKIRKDVRNLVFKSLIVPMINRLSTLMRY
jgi:hypothetical protein